MPSGKQGGEHSCGVGNAGGRKAGGAFRERAEKIQAVWGAVPCACEEVWKKAGGVPSVGPGIPDKGESVWACAGRVYGVVPVKGCVEIGYYI